MLIRSSETDVSFINAGNVFMRSLLRYYICVVSCSMHQSISYSHSISLLRSVAIHMQTETVEPLLKRIKTEADEAAAKMLMPPPSSEYLYKHKDTDQPGGDLLRKRVYFLNPHT